MYKRQLYTKKPGRSFLISESVRGEGALLYNAKGERFANELMPRDLLTEAIRAQMAADGTDFVWEDLRPIGEEEIKNHFPNIYARCLEEGYDVTRECIPVTPAQQDVYKRQLYTWSANTVSSSTPSVYVTVYVTVGKGNVVVVVAGL